MHNHSHDNLTGEMPGSHRYQEILMAVFFVLWGLDSFLLRITTFLSGPVPLSLHLVVGVGILVAAVYFMDASHKHLFDSQVAGLATGGVYARVRHPMYLGTFMLYLGLAVTTLSLASLGIWLIIFAFYNTMASYEEKKLEERFGNQFLEYKQKVRKWIPL